MNAHDQAREALYIAGPDEDGDYWLHINAPSGISAGWVLKGKGTPIGLKVLAEVSSVIAANEARDSAPAEVEAALACQAAVNRQRCGAEMSCSTCLIIGETALPECRALATIHAALSQPSVEEVGGSEASVAEVVGQLAATCPRKDGKTCPGCGYRLADGRVPSCEELLAGQVAFFERAHRSHAAALDATCEREEAERAALAAKQPRPSAEDVAWLRKFINCMPFGADAPQSDIDRAHAILASLEVGA